MIDEHEFIDLMSHLCLKMQREFKREMITSWYEDLSRFSRRTLENVTREWWRRNDRFPSLSNLIAACEAAEPARKTLETEIHPVNLPAARLLLKIFEARGDHKELIAACEEAIARNPDLADLFLRMIKAAATGNEKGHP